jgi:ribosomal protein L40E
MVTAVLAVFTITSYCLASSKSAGAPTNVRWGSYPLVGKRDLENYTFCTYCNKPKPPRAHHCRSCKMCVVDMDHHCPFVSMITAFCYIIVLLIVRLHLFIHPPFCSSADWQLCGSFKSSSVCHFSYFCGH